MSKKDLKPEWRRFCEEYVIDWNQTRAYMVAYPSSKYNSAAVNASKLLKNTKVKAYINEIKDNLSEQSGITALGVLLELKKVGFSNISDLKKNWEEFKEWDDLTEAQKAAISEITHTETTTGEDSTLKVTKVKLHSKLGAIDRIIKMLGFDATEQTDAFKDLTFKIVQKK